MPTTAPYDDVADWYENEFLVLQRAIGDGESADRELLNTIVATGFTLEQFDEGAEPTPVVLSLRARKTDG